RVRAAFGPEALKRVTYVPADLEKKDLGEVLATAGHDPEARSVVVWSGVTVYLEPAAVARTLGWMARQAKGSCLVFDYCWQEAVDGTTTDPVAAKIRAITSSKGEHWQFGIGRGETKEYLAKHGLTLNEDYTFDELKVKYIT